MKQGEIWELYLNPTKGSEQSGRRPAIIISGNMLNKHLQVVIVCPLTTSVKNYKGNLIINPNEINGLTTISEVLTFHVRSVSKTRLDKKIGKIPLKDIEVIKKTLNDILKF
ncbi:type II toxin-antitoxin system PemK/MazF family toxin [Polaribacter undariae]|uniref:mRNA interferase n=1 Tax=Polaribacter sejongensis TaxID=985043 RepID=A0AAJ1QTG0_9FLAO|nr:type II toxin-antitoxin system PemK/MazF family toxin [Polaribacter undariae]MDN3618004.1 type II toxin-antitoxin system PemK/MazF family toxin [Polaribacter undariae]UWD31964.1 type II toxin-antitoxin system PemK/MazF family toxin [Polaribacter undariae]